MRTGLVAVLGSASLLLLVGMAVVGPARGPAALRRAVRPDGLPGSEVVELLRPRTPLGTAVETAPPATAGPALEAPTGTGATARVRPPAPPAEAPGTEEAGAPPTQTGNVERVPNEACIEG